MVESRKLDYEILDRWIKYMDKTTDKYHNKEAWQAMMKKSGGTQAEAKKLADKFQEDVIEVMLAKDDLDAENQSHHRQGRHGHQAEEAHRQAQQLRQNKDFNPGLRPAPARACRKSRITSGPRFSCAN